MRRVTAKLREWIAKRNKFRRVLARSEAREDDLLGAIKDAERRIRRKRRKRRGLRNENARARLADAIEELEAAIDQLTDRLDKRERRSERVEQHLLHARARVKRLRERRERLKAQRGNLTANFSMVEFDCREGDSTPGYMEPHLRDLCQRVLEKMRSRFGACRVNSGHRWSWYNARIGGASLSYHVYENRKNQPAADCVFARGTPSEWAAYARSLGVGGVGQYSGFVHVDTGPRRDWWG